MPLPKRQITRQAAPEASFEPGDFSSGFQIPDGDYNVKTCMTGAHTYGGTVPDGVPAFLVLYEDDNGATYEQPYKAGDNEHLQPSDDGETFVHPDGQSPAKIYGNGAAAMWLKSWKEAGHQFTGNQASQFTGLRVRLVSAAAPKGKTSDNPDRTLPLIGKILGKAPQSRPTSSASRTAPRSSTPTRPTSAASRAQAAPVNGELDDAALGLVLEVLEKAADQTMTVSKLGMAVWMAAQKNADYKSQASAIKKLITPEFLTGKDGIETDGESVALAS